MDAPKPAIASRLSTRLLAGGLLAAMCALALWWLRPAAPQPSSPTVDRSRALTAGARSSEAAPRRHLPTRTYAPRVDVEPTWVCPLKLTDARTLLQLDAAPEALPLRARMSFTPPVLPSMEVQLDDTAGTATFQASDAARITALPWAAGAASGYIPGLGDTVLAIDGDSCGMMVVLVESESTSDGIRCPLSEDLSLAQGHQVTLAGGPYEGRAVRNRIVEEDLLLRGVDDTGEAWLRVSEHPPVLITWQEGECDPIEVPEAALVAVEVIGTSPRSPIWVKGCGVIERLPKDATSVDLEVAAMPCALEAWRTDGLLRALSPLVTIDPRPGRTTNVQLRLPESSTGGIGISFRTGDEAVSVRSVHRDSPAWEAGLRSGDRIVAVDGEPTGGLQQNDFIALGTGPVGSEVSLVVEAEDGTIDELTLERAVLRN